VHPSVTYEDITIHNVTQDVTIGVMTWPTLTVGTGSGEALAPGVALLIKWTTGFIKELGRKFLGGFTEGGAGGGGWTSPALSAAADMVVALAGPLTPILLGSTYLVGLYNKSAVFHAFTAAVVSGVAAYQRRRRQNRGI
jgi:hypothetical protein